MVAMEWPGSAALIALAPSYAVTLDASGAFLDSEFTK
jgi:hypothetical protein